jgi:ribose transport system substrate-binding protein
MLTLIFVFRILVRQLHPALREATKQGIVTIPFNLPVDGEAWTAFTGTDPEKKGFGLRKMAARGIG